MQPLKYALRKKSHRSVIQDAERRMALRGL